MNKELTADQIIDAIGGTSETARLCEVEPASVSEWRKKGIPHARRMFLELARPDVFADPAPEAPPTERRRPTAQLERETEGSGMRGSQREPK